MLEEGGVTRESLDGALGGCGNELLYSEISSGRVTVAALGEGDFNHFDAKSSLSALRFYPFLSNNLFISRAPARSPRVEGVEIVTENKQDRLLFPHSPITLDFRKAATVEAVKQIKLQPKITGQLLGQNGVEEEFGWSLIFDFKNQVIRYHRSARVGGGDRTYLFPFEKRFVVSDAKAGKIRLVPPVPLLPRETYEVEVTGTQLNIKLTFATYEAFSITEERADPSQLPEDRKPTVIRPSERVQGNWVGRQIPIVRPADSPLVRVLSFLDSEAAKRLDRSSCGAGENEQKTICMLRVAAVKESVVYWSKVLGWLEGLQSLDRFESWVLKDMNGAPAPLAAIKAEVDQLRAGGALPQPEQKAWDVLNNWKEQCIQAKQSVSCSLPLEIDLRIESLRRSMLVVQETPGLILLLEMTGGKAHDLLADLKGLLPKSFWPVPNILLASSQAASGIPRVPHEIEAPNSAILVAPEENARSVVEVMLVIGASSAWQTKEASFQQSPVVGIPPEIIRNTGGRPCCSPGFVEKIGRLLEPANGLVKSDVDPNHFYQAMLQQMRVDASSEAVFVQQGLFDISPLRWLRAFKIIGGPADNKIYFHSPIADLDRVPGLEGLGRSIRAERVDSLAKLEQFLAVKQRAHAFDWAQWFFKGCSDCRNDKPQLYEDEVLRLAQQRIIFTRDRLMKVTTTAAQLAKIAGLKDPSLQKLGIETVKENDKTKHKIHGIELAGTTPTVTALPARLAQSTGPIAELAKSHVQREGVGGAPSLTLSSVLDHLINRPPPEEPLKEQIEIYDRKPWWSVSLKQFEFEWKQTGVTDDFSVLASEPRTKSRDETRWTIKPDLEVGFFWPPGSLWGNLPLDWKTNFSLNFGLNEIEPKITKATGLPVVEDVFRNALEDEWKIRSQADLFLWKRWVGIYLAGEFVGQLKGRFRSLSIPFTDNDGKPQQQPFALADIRKREFNTEAGFVFGDSAKTRKLSVGFQYSYDLNRLNGVKLFPDAGNPFTVPIGKLSAEIAARLDTGETLLNRDLELTAELMRDQAQQLGLALAGEYKRDVHSWNDGQKKITFTTKLTEADFFFRRDATNATQPQVRVLWETNVSIPLIGNLALTPSLEGFFFRLHENPTDPEAKRFFKRWTPTVKFVYSFDAKPGFQSFWRRALWFHSKGK